MVISAWGGVEVKNFTPLIKEILAESQNSRVSEFWEFGLENQSLICHYLHDFRKDINPESVQRFMQGISMVSEIRQIAYSKGIQFLRILVGDHTLMVIRACDDVIVGPGGLMR